MTENKGKTAVTSYFIEVYDTPGHGIAKTHAVRIVKLLYLPKRCIGLA